MRDDSIGIGDMIRVSFGQGESPYVGIVVDITDEGESIGYGDYVRGEYEDYYDYEVLFFGESDTMCVYATEIVEIVSKVTL
jgi:hypothetical protein